MLQSSEQNILFGVMNGVVLVDTFNSANWAKKTSVHLEQAPCLAPIPVN